jgi:uncharacterized membrane protein YciS (DUF1049 family)
VGIVVVAVVVLEVGMTAAEAAAARATRAMKEEGECIFSVVFVVVDVVGVVVGVVGVGVVGVGVGVVVVDLEKKKDKAREEMAWFYTRTCGAHVESHRVGEVV